MSIRRVVTGHDKDGKSFFVHDGIPPWSKDFQHTPGFSSSVVWMTSAHASANSNDPTIAVTSIVPGPGGTSFLMVTFPPDSVMADPTFDASAASQEHANESPGLVAFFEPDSPGMHTTPTIDYGIVLEGEIWLELDDGRTMHLKKHDVIVQNATRHAWRNKGTTPAMLAFILVGCGP